MSESNSVPGDDIFARRRRIAVVVLALFAGALAPAITLMVAIIFYGFFGHSDLGTGILFLSLPVIAMYGVVVLSVPFAIMLKRNARNPFLFGMVGGVVYCLLYYLISTFYHVEFIVLGVLSFFAMGVASGLVFWGIAVRKNAALN